MRVRVRHHVNPLRAGATGPGEPIPLSAGRPVEVELGCADALFLFERAAAHPEIDCVGVEIRRELVEDVNRRAAASGLGNLRAFFANINDELRALFPDGALDRVFVNFPDPWFKERHKKRRVMTEEVAATIAAQLKPGGELLFQSDVWDLALDALSVLEREPRLVNVHGEWSFATDHPYGARSLREVRCTERGMRIWRMRYRRAS